MLANKPLRRGQFMALSMQHVCLCTRRRGKEVKKRGLTLTFLKLFLFSTFDSDLEALLERGSWKTSQSTKCYVFILSNHSAM